MQHIFHVHGAYYAAEHLMIAMHPTYVLLKLEFSQIEQACSMQRESHTLALHVELVPYILPTPFLFSVFLFTTSSSSPI